MMNIFSFELMDSDLTKSFLPSSTGVDDVLLGLRSDRAAELRRSRPPVAAVGFALQVAFLLGAGTSQPTGHV